jgi:L-lactate dehydrogenase complex protein LldF
MLGGGDRMVSHLPLAGGWTKGREFPSGPGRTFRELYAARKKS